MTKKNDNMWKCFRLYFVMLLVVPGLLVTVSCSKKIVQSDPAVEEEVVAVDDTNTAVPEKTEPAPQQDQIAEEASKEADMQREKMEAQQMFMDNDIYFAFESAVLMDKAKEILSQKAEWLLTNPDTSIIIEGHCDERGTSAYNIALGDRRAESARSYLVDLGIDTTQLSKISYGEERPVDTGNSEDAWSKNRRVHFVVE